MYSHQDQGPDAGVPGGRLAGKVAFITGAGGSLGRAVAIRFAREGAEALVLADARADLAVGVADDVRALGVRASVGGFDVRDGEAFDRAAEEAAAAFGRLDVLVNNAGALPPNARIHNLTTADWEDCLAVNLTGTFHGIRAALRVMRPRRAGAIINTASVSGLTAWPYAAPYGAAKAAVIHLTRVAALESAKERIRVNCVCPGAFRSGIHDGLPGDALDAIAKRHPLGLGQAGDLAGAFAYLASDDAAWVTGTSLVADGGYSLP